MVINNKFLFKLQLRFPWLAKTGIFKFITAGDGYIPEEEQPHFKQYGASNDLPIINPSGQYIEYLPVDEAQRLKDADSMACTCFGTNNGIEIYANAKWHENWNNSDRFPAKNSGVTRNGNSVSNVISSINSDGLVGEILWPTLPEMTWNEFYSAIPSNIKAEGKKWTHEYKLEMQTVGTHTSLMMDALKRGPLGVGVFAWYKYRDTYRSYGKANHWCVVIGYKEGEYWLVYDSIAPFVKKLAWDFRFAVAKVITVKRLKDIDKLESLRRRGFKYIQRTDKLNGGRGEMYEINDNGLRELTKDDKIQQGAKMLAERKDLTGVSEELFKQLI